MIQAGSQSISALLQGPNRATGLVGAAQATGIQGNISQSDFSSTLQTSFQNLFQPGLEHSGDARSSQILADLKALLEQQLAASGNAVPLTTVDDSVEDIDIDALITRLQALLDNNDGTATLASSASVSLNPADIPPHMQGAAGFVPGSEVGQILADRRRLAERFSVLINANPAVNRELPEVLDNRLAPGQATADSINKDNPGLDWMKQLYSRQIKSVQEYSEGGQLKEQANLVTESRNILSALTVAGDKALLADAPDTAFSLASMSSLTKPVASTAAGEIRPIQLFIPASLQDPQWQADFSQRVSVIARGGNQIAEIRLNPANLGPIEVRVVMSDDQATITFSSQHGAVREAIEASLPRLREMFSASGLQLADTQVSDQALSGQQQQRQERENVSDGHGRFQGENSVAAGPGDVETTIGLSHIQAASDLRGIDLFV